MARHSDEQVEQLKHKIVNVAKKIENEEFTYKENRYCPCDFGYLCPLYMHKYKREEQQEEKTGIDIINTVDEYGAIKDQGKELSAQAEALQKVIKECMSSNQMGQFSPVF